MGWKNVKNHYRIEHFVHLRDGNLCVGSAYIPDIIVVRPDGTLLKESGSAYADIRRYQSEIEADPATFERLMQEPDQFTASTPVYSFVDGQVLTLQCEEPGWPNVTHDGQLMYDNRYFIDRAKCIEKAIAEYDAGASMARRDIASAEAELRSSRNELTQFEGYAAALKALSVSPTAGDLHG